MDETGRLPPRSVILLGVSVRAAAHSAWRAGWQPVGIDCFADRDLAACGPAIRISRYPVEFLRALTEAPQAPWIYTGSLENYPRLVDRLAARRPLWGNPGRVLAQVRQVSFLADAAHAAGLPFPETRESPPQGPQLAAGWLTKPRRGGGGVGVRPWQPPQGMPTLPRGCYLQRLVEGEPAGAVFLFASGQATLLGVTRQLLARDVSGPSPFQYAGSVGPIAPCPWEQHALERLGGILAQRAALRGLVNLDYLRQPQTLVPLEINPRYSASVEVLERACDAALLAWHIAACGGPEAPLRPATLTPRRIAGKVVVYAPGPVGAEDLEQASQRAQLASDGIAVADLPAQDVRAAAGQPLCTLLAQGSDEAEVQRRLVQAAGRLTQQLRQQACDRGP